MAPPRCRRAFRQQRNNSSVWPTLRCIAPKRPDGIKPCACRFLNKGTGVKATDTTLSGGLPHDASMAENNNRLVWFEIPAADFDRARSGFMKRCLSSPCRPRLLARGRWPFPHTRNRAVGRCVIADVNLKPAAGERQQGIQRGRGVQIPHPAPSFLRDWERSPASAIPRGTSSGSMR